GVVRLPATAQRAVSAGRHPASSGGHGTVKNVFIQEPGKERIQVPFRGQVILAVTGIPYYVDGFPCTPRPLVGALDELVEPAVAHHSAPPIRMVSRTPCRPLGPTPMWISVVSSGTSTSMSRKLSPRTRPMGRNTASGPLPIRAHHVGLPWMWYCRLLMRPLLCSTTLMIARTSMRLPCCVSTIHHSQGEQQANKT